MKALVIVLLLVAPLQAQKPVEQWADWSSYPTAVANPARAAVEAWRSSSRGCRFGQLAISEGLGNGVTMIAKRSYASPRPCLGCAPDGMPSGHTMNSVIGAGSAWGGGWKGVLLSAGFVAATGFLRHEANRHTWRQITAGALLGAGSELAGHALRCRD